MTVTLPRLGGSANPLSSNRLLVALYRIFAIGVAFVLIRSTHVDNDIVGGLLVSLAVFLGLYLVFGRSGVLRPLILYLIITGFSAQLRLFADQTGIPVQFAYVPAIEKAIFGGVPNLWLQDHLYKEGQSSLVAVYSTAIYFSFFGASYIMAFVLWARWRVFFPIYATAVCISAYIGVIVDFVLPTAPPWMAGQNGHIATVHRVVQELSSHVDSNAYDGGASVVGVNQVAAMPSIHMAFTVLVVMAIWRLTENVPARLLSLLYGASMAFALVFLGEHYVTDEFFGLVTALIAWYCAHRLWSDGHFNLKIPTIFARDPGIQPTEEQRSN